MYANRLAIALLLFVTWNAQAQSDESCSDALIVATYSRIDTQGTDYRLAWHVSESAYEEVKRKAGVNATIYGIPVGGNYLEFQKNMREKTANYASSYTHSEATNVKWTGLDPNGANAYTECIKAKKFSQHGLKLAVKSATQNEVSVLVNWTPRGKQTNARPQWFWDAEGSTRLPKTLVAGEKTVVLPRPIKQQTLTVNFEGSTDNLIIEPFPPPVTIKPIEFIDELKEYEGDVAVGWSTGWSAPQTICTPEMPSGWSIKSVQLRLESHTERTLCGSWTVCGGQQTDTPTRACRTVVVQGHEKGRYDGYGRAKPVLSVIWRHPK